MATPPSAAVQALLDLIPDRVGFRFTGLPDLPHLHPDNLYDWSPDEPEIIRSRYSEMVYPNDQHPEDRVITVTNRKGEKVDYPYHEDAEGKRYFLSAHVWYKKKDYVLGQLQNVANEDPLGAARILYQWALIYEGYVPTNEYPWHNQPVEPASTPPHYYWGGMWYRWSAGELTNFRPLSEAYAQIADTTAFEELSDEVGEDTRHKVVAEMFLPSIEYVRSYSILYHNMEYHNARGLASLGKALKDPSYIHEVVEWAENYARNTYLFDGFFEENTLSYHNQSTNGLATVITDVRGWTDPPNYVSPRNGGRLDDLDLSQRVPVLDAAMRIPQLLVYPDGKYFPTQDTWASDRSGNPDWSVGSFLLPASGMARLMRGRVGGDGGYYGTPYAFPELEIVDQSADARVFADSGTVQLEANEAGHHITFTFEVPAADNYDLDLKVFKAGSYGIYAVELDGTTLTELDFFTTGGNGPQPFETVANVDLAAGQHELTFRNVGKNAEATNFKMGVIQLAILDETARNQRDEGGNDDVNPSQLYMTFTPKYGHHHLDPLDLVLWANGQELVPDIGYTHTLYRWRTVSTLGHNTVTVDASDSADTGPAEHGGNVEIFAPIDNTLQVMRASHPTAYPQTSQYSREPWFIRFPNAASNEGYVLDLFRVAGGTRHEFALQADANRDAALETEIPLTDYNDYLVPEGVTVTEPTRETEKGDAEGHYYGYIFVRNVKRAELPEGRYEITFTTEDEDGPKSRLAVTGLVESGPNELFVGDAPSMRATRLHGTSHDINDEAVKYAHPKFVLRREGDDLTSTFITALEPYAADATPRIDDVRRLTPEGSMAIAVQVDYGNTSDILLSTLDPTEPLVVDDLTLEGKLGFVRLVDGAVSQMYLIGGTSLRKGDVELTDTGPVTGEVTAVERRGAGASRDAFIVSTQVPEAMEGRTIVITHPDGKTHGYAIAAVEDDGTAVRIEGVDPGFTINDDGTSQLEFHPYTAWTGPTTFRIENVTHRAG